MKKIIKKIIYYILSTSRITLFIDKLFFRNSFTVLAYHAISPRPLAIRDWCFLDASVFREQMRHLRDNFEIVPLSSAIKAMQNNNINRRLAVVTFDDGYMNNYDVAFPTMVDPTLRGKGIGTRLISAMLEQYKKFSIVVWMNEPNARVFEKCGWQPVANIPSFVRVYNTVPFVTGKLGNIGKPIGLLLNMGLQLIYMLDHIFFADKANPEYRIEAVKEFDERIDVLFDQIRTSYFCISYRSRELLNWRYAHSNSAGFKKIICTKKDDIAGYLVYKTRADKNSGKLITTIYDYLSNGDEGGAFTCLFRKAMYFIEQDKPDQIEIICTSEAHIPVLKKNLFFRGWDNPDALKYIHTRGIDHAEKFADGRNWFFTYGDGDRLFWDL